MTDVVGLVINTNGVNLAPAGDSEYIEIAPEDEDVVVDEFLSGGDEVPEDINVVRTLVVADLVAVYDAAEALMHSERSWGRRAAEREALANAVAVAGR